MSKRHVCIFVFVGISLLLVGCGKESPTITSSAEEDQAPYGTAHKAAIPNSPIDVATESDIYVLSSAGAVTIVDLVGDQDNFGYGGTANPPCVFYNLSEPVDDLGIFDRELTSGDEVESWTHDFTSSLCPGFVADSVLVEIPEKFSDFTRSTITIDGTTLNFTPNGFSRCGPFILQTFLFTGTAAAFANDGIVNITFRELGDNIALDYSRLTVKGTCGEVDIDIRPKLCPNPLDINSPYTITVGVLGTQNFDIQDLDKNSVRLEGVAPLQIIYNLTDRSQPVVNPQDVCDCTAAGGDGFLDREFLFKIPNIVAALDSVNNGDEVVLTLTGNLNDGTPIQGQDCVIIQTGHGGGPGHK